MTLAQLPSLLVSLGIISLCLGVAQISVERIQRVATGMSMLAAVLLLIAIYEWFR